MKNQDFGPRLSPSVRFLMSVGGRCRDGRNEQQPEENYEPSFQLSQAGTSETFNGKNELQWSGQKDKVLLPKKRNRCPVYSTFNSRRL
jgi:hypothetical protein